MHGEGLCATVDYIALYLFHSVLLSGTNTIVTFSFALRYHDGHLIMIGPIPITSKSQCVPRLVYPKASCERGVL